MTSVTNALLGQINSVKNINNGKAYFELSTVRSTAIVSHICSESIDENPNRIKYGIGESFFANESIIDLLRFLGVDKEIQQNEELDNLFEKEPILREDLELHHCEFTLFFRNDTWGFYVAEDLSDNAKKLINLEKVDNFEKLISKANLAVNQLIKALRKNGINSKPTN